jgi:asparagine synthase (glutamine-hydrolysing)
MCGIAGLYAPDRAPIAEAAVRAMTDAIRHRGPDGDGFFTAPGIAIGMRRLSIIDVAGSDQPLYNEDRSIALVFNGEIYNYRELRAELAAQGHIFRTEGDGETLIHLIEQYGIAGLRRVRGMFAFALWNTAAETLILAIDHIGMKPVYTAEVGGRFAFASEVKSLTAAGLAPALEPAALDLFMRFGYPIGPRTLFTGVSRLMPGTAVIVHDGRAHTETWASLDAPLPARPPMPTDPAAVIARIGDGVNEAVRLHLRADVPLGLFLSGGIDSAVVLAHMTRAVGPVATYTVGYAAATPDNELEAAARIAGHFGARHHARVITAEDWWAAFDRYILHHDEPNANPSAVSLMLLAEHTARDVRVVLTGLGGDELFSGYAGHSLLTRILAARPGRAGAMLGAMLGALEPAYPAFKRWRGLGALPHLLTRARYPLLAGAQPRSRERALLAAQSYDGFVMHERLRTALYGGRFTRISTDEAFAAVLERSRAHDDGLHPADRAQRIVMETWLHGNALLNCDKVTMAHSLEARVPFFDPALIADALHTPAALRTLANKHLLREAARPLLPAFALARPKQPFGTPIGAWFAHALAPRIRERLCAPDARVRALFAPRALDRVLDAHFSGRAVYTEVVFRLLTLETWLHTWGVSP